LRHWFGQEEWENLKKNILEINQKLKI